jgi:MYXO-CTERM domain-containing protein
MNTKHRASLAGCIVALTGVFAAGAAHADQFVVLDETWDHTPDMPDSHYRVDPTPETPDDWVNGTDYSDGSAWVYLEVQTKPTDQETKFQVCFEATPTYACTAQSPTYTTVGTVEWETKFSDFWSPPNTEVDWTQGTNRIACILKDTMNNKPSADNVGDEIAALYMPTRVRMVVTIVEEGSVYVPPTPTGEGGGGGGGSTTTAATTGTTSATTKAATTATAGPTTAASTGAGGTTGSGGGSGTSPEDDGCSVSTDGTPSAFVGWVLGVIAFGAAFVTRRRRRA